LKKVTYPFKNEVNGTIRPFIPVLLINPSTGDQIKINALIDTGADKCAFPRYCADATKHNLKGKGVKKEISGGIGGIQVPTWIHTFVICLLDPTGKKVLKTSNRLPIACFEHNQAPPLLGGNDFLIDLEVNFNYKSKEITISFD